MAITQVGSATTATSAGATSISVAKPTGVASGDVLIAHFSHNDQTATLTGWTLVNSTKSPGVAFRDGLFYKVAGGSEPASYTFSVPANTGPLVGSITAWRGVDTSAPINDEAVTGVDDPTEPPTTPSATTSFAVTRVFYFRAARRPSSTSNADIPTFSESVTGVSEELDVGVFSGGTTCYAHALYSKDADETASGTKAGIAISNSQTNNVQGNVLRTFALKADVPESSGSVAGTLPAVTAAITATASHDGPLSGALPAPTAAFAGEHFAPADGPVAATLPALSGAFAGGVEGLATMAGTLPAVTASLAAEIVFGPLAGTLPAVTAALVVETRPFGPNVLAVEPEDRRVVMTE
ncbi:hypothetical protein C6N75_09920 [Streptomyces solincola]|uniref:Uncharacterized protein n=1 Tax=Streptomyces solincola TaxID=2100817 RepID=A0A2S9PY98_9ACTN|nr:hypothetical protein [Streptomyces solincola]PRH79390.1 hypothetical protein C6N75_09920 [Streptomyces solincola]